MLKEVLLANPGSRLAFVGDGPQKAELEKFFAGMPVKFMVRMIHVLNTIFQSFGLQ